MVLEHFKAPKDRLMQWAPLALTFLAGGLFVGEYWPGNKQLWSPAYVMIMAGAFRCSFLLFGGMRGFPRASEVAGCVKCGFSLSHVALCGLSRGSVWPLAPGGNGLSLAVFYSLLDWTDWQPNWLVSKCM